MSFMKNVGTVLLLKHKYKENLDYRFGLAFIWVIVFVLFVGCIGRNVTREKAVKVKNQQLAQPQTRASTKSLVYWTRTNKPFSSLHMTKQTRLNWKTRPASNCDIYGPERGSCRLSSTGARRAVSGHHGAVWPMSGIVEQGWQTHTARCRRRSQALLLGGGHPLRHVAVS